MMTERALKMEEVENARQMIMDGMARNVFNHVKSNNISDQVETKRKTND